VLQLLSVCVSESGAIILVGILFGSVLRIINNTTDAQATDLSVGLLRFSSLAFFLLLLPPIIFNSGYHINRDLFFPLLPAVSFYAILGTTISTVIIGLLLWACSDMYSLAEVLTFGALISATDPVSTLATFQSKRVDPVLFYLVFGESVVNDAVGLVLFETLKKFVGYQHTTTTGFIAFVDFCVIFFGSVALGLLVGVICSLVFKCTNMRSYPHIEVSLYVLIVYVPFIVAEVLSMSGIVTIMVTGMMCKCFAVRNITPESKSTADDVFRILAHLAETAIFLELGLAVAGLTGDSFKPVFILLALLACLVGRAVNIYPLSWILNTFIYTKASGSSQIPMKTQHMLMYSGLRGAVAFACATTFPGENSGEFVGATMAIVLVTVFLLGGGTESALDKLDISVDVDESLFDASEVPAMKSIKVIDRCVERVSLWTETLLVRDMSKVVDAISKDEGNAIEMTASKTQSERSSEDHRGEDSDSASLVLNAELGIMNEEGGKVKGRGKGLVRTASSLFDFGVKK
jgi:sodium/hydrogen exchanger 8